MNERKREGDKFPIIPNITICLVLSCPKGLISKNTIHVMQPCS